MTTAAQRETTEQQAALALDLIRRLASGVGLRRPCSEAEAAAAHAAVGWLAERDVSAQIEPFRGYPTFARPYGLILGVALAGALLQGRRRTGDALSLAALARLCSRAICALRLCPTCWSGTRAATSWQASRPAGSNGSASASAATWTRAARA